MKIFNKVDGWETKVNFVDEYNVVLGYDLAQDCCEHADWFIRDYMKQEYDYDLDVEVGREDDYSNYRFDTTFFMENPEWIVRCWSNGHFSHH